MPPSHRYRQRDYEFADTFVTLRTSIGLTQAGLARHLGVASRTVENWEQGLTGPKAESLKAFLVLCVRNAAFAAGHEEEQIRAFWKAARQKVLLDELWLHELLSQYTLPVVHVAVEASSISSKEIALWTVPYARNPHFTGRDEQLDQLTAQLSPQEAGQSAALRRAALTQAQVIKGLGGIGKTQTAIEYAYRAREQGRYAHTLWISAAGEESIIASFTALAELLPDVVPAGETDQRKLVTSVLRWLEQSKEPWLLIFDNADDLSMVQPYLPVRGNGSILLTTRASAAGWLAPSLEMDVLGETEAIELLLRRAQRFAHASEEEISKAGQLALALGQFPLALDQAGAYIEETGCSVREYQELYQTHRGALLERRGRQATGYPASVATTWALSFEYVERQSPAAAELLQLCAVLAPDHIPEELLTDGAPYWPPTLQQAVSDRFRFNQALETLLAFSLVKRLAQERQLSIHRLVQAVQEERLPPEEQRRWTERLVRAVNVVFPREPQEVASWPACQRYLDQVQACDALLYQQHLVLPEAADVFDRASAYLGERALYSLAEPLCRRALAIREQLVGEAHPTSVRSMAHLATLYFEQGEFAAAEALYQRALPLAEQVVESEPSLLVEALRGLAHVYVDQRKDAQAESLYRRAFPIWEQLAEAEQARLLGILGGLAFVQAQQGKYAEAELLSRRALRIREQHFGPEHLLVGTSLMALAQIAFMKEEDADVEPLFLRALRIHEQHLGPEHPRVAFPLHELARLYTGQSRYGEAELLLLRALHIREQQVGPESRDVSDSLRGLADLYYREGKYAEAEPLFRRALRIREQLLGPESLVLTDPLLGLANLSRDQGKYAEAEPLYRRVLRIREQQAGADDLVTADTRHEFAVLQQAQGHLLEATRLYQRALTTREHVLGPDHPLTTNTRERLRGVLAALGQREEAADVEAAHQEAGIAAMKDQMSEE